MIEETLHRYAAQDVPPTRLQAAEVLAEARRRNRRRTRLTGVVAGAAAALVTIGGVAVVRAVVPTGPSVTVAGADCVAVRLEVPAGMTGGATATGIDPSGRYVIGVTGARDEPRAVLWTDAAAAVLPESFTPQAVNASGLIAGYSGPNRKSQESQQRPVVYDGTRLVSLPLPAGAVGGVAYAINAAGDVLGTVMSNDRTPSAVRWRTTGTPAVVTRVPGASGLGLTDDGVAVGFDLPAPHPRRWGADGATTDLPFPRGMTREATAVSAAGDWAVGDASDGPEQSRALRWNLRTGAVELIAGFTAWRVSASGAVGGLAGGTSAPSLWRDGRIVTLPVPRGGIVPGSTVTGITADGRDLVGGVLLAGGPAATAAPAGDPVADQRTVPIAWRGC